MKSFLKYVFVSVVAVVLAACSGGKCVTDSNSNLIYDFNNGAALYGNNNLQVNQGSSVSAEYVLSGNVAESFAVMLSTDNPLLTVKVVSKQLQSNTGCELCGSFSPDIVQLNKYLSESDSTLVVSSAANLAPGTYTLNLFADGVNGTNFPHTKIGQITIIVVAGILTASPSRVDFDATDNTQEIVLTNNGQNVLSNLTLPALESPLSLVATSCTNGQSLLAGESCAYTVKYNSVSESGNEVLLFTYHDGSSIQSTSVNVVWAAYFKFWTLITGGVNQPTGVNEVYGSPTTNKIVVSSADGYLWTYNNSVWTQICNGENSTPAAYGSVVGFATVESLLYNTNDTLWAYNNGTWSQLASGVNPTVGAPSGNISVSENSTPNMIVGLDHADSQVWIYNNSTWTKITGGNNQPASLLMISKAAPTVNDVVGYNSAGEIWQYHNGLWTKIGNGTTPPNPYAATLGGTFFGISTASSVIFNPNSSDITSALWVYNGSSWSQYSGSNVNNSPTNAQVIFGVPDNNSLIIRDGHAVVAPDYNQYYIWTYLNGTWTQITTGNGTSAPQYGWFVFGETATPNHLFMTDGQDSATANLWEWYQNSWLKLTGQASGPTSVNFVGGNPTHTSFVMSDGTVNGNYNTQLWTYVSGVWSNITGHTDEPNGVQQIYGLVNPNAIVITANPHRDGLQGKGAQELWVGKR